MQLAVYNFCDQSFGVFARQQSQNALAAVSGVRRGSSAESSKKVGTDGKWEGM